jgi:hypothetical protein
MFKGANVIFFGDDLELGKSGVYLVLVAIIWKKRDIISALPIIIIN